MRTTPTCSSPAVTMLEGLGDLDAGDTARISGSGGQRIAATER